ncbi:hypothetical protein [Clostridium sardiniense]|uniref:hypothetical protein n=1 Tax=Clostridium sardiniense TaxID=29369 RepID=UPI00195F2458|nr:hypothetical protein [Clostridium sardiniense]MBM7836359.1 hypothetical protein [Clostridium sardiniense]
MRYIGPFFRMNSLSQDEVCGQLFHLSKEAVKILTLNSKCGCTFSSRNSKKNTSTKDISILSKFSPVLCLYKKSSPIFMHNKTSHGFDSSSFKREVNPSTNALMTMSLLELSDYYSHFNKKASKDSLKDAYRYLAHEQLDFYYENLRNSEGIFITKKSLFESESKDGNLIEKDRKFIFSDQAFMMNAYYLYSLYAKDEEAKEEYKEFSSQILQMFLDYKEALYNLSFDEGLKTLLAFNIYYEYSNDNEIVSLITDLSEFLINKFDEKDYYIESLDLCALFAINLMYSYEHTGLITFKEKYNEIMERLLSLYDEDNNIIQKLTDKKEIKYTSFDLCFYLISVIMFANKSDLLREYTPMISKIYKKYFLNSNLITSWPDAPDLDNVERYKHFSMLSKDMLDETFFRMPSLPTLTSTGLSPIFLKNITYSRKKDIFTTSSSKSFDSYKNMFIFFMFIHVFKDNFFEKLEIKEPNFEFRNSSSDETTSTNVDIITDTADDTMANTNDDITINKNAESQTSVGPSVNEREVKDETTIDGTSENTDVISKTYDN